jgi:hypothetical protein
MSVRARKVLPPRGCTFFSTSRTENFTSSLENGLPSWKRTPRRSLKVMLLPSAATCHDSARLATGFRLKSYSSSPS